MSVQESGFERRAILVPSNRSSRATEGERTSPEKLRARPPVPKEGPMGKTKNRTDGGKAQAAPASQSAQRITERPSFAELLADYRAASITADEAYAAYNRAYNDQPKMTERLRAQVDAAKAAVPFPDLLKVSHDPSAAFPVKVQMVATYADGATKASDIDVGPFNELRGPEAVLEHCKKRGEDPAPLLTALAAWTTAQEDAGRSVAPDCYAGNDRVRALEGKWERLNGQVSRKLDRLVAVPAANLTEVSLKLELIMERIENRKHATRAIKALAAGKEPDFGGPEGTDLACIVRDLFALANRPANDSGSAPFVPTAAHERYALAYARWLNASRQDEELGREADRLEIGSKDYDSAQARSDEASDARGRAFAALMETPAPDLRTEIQKLHLLVKETPFCQGTDHDPVWATEIPHIREGAALRRIRAEFRQLMPEAKENYPYSGYPGPDPILAVMTKAKELIEKTEAEDQAGLHPQPSHLELVGLVQTVDRMRARTFEAAVFQIALALAENDLIKMAREESDPAHDRVDRLLSSALNVLVPRPMDTVLDNYAGTVAHVVAKELSDELDGSFDAQDFLASYRAIGGNFSLTMHEGQCWLGHQFPIEDRGGRPGPNMQAVFWPNPWQERAIFRELEREEAQRDRANRLGQRDAVQPNTSRA